LPHYKCATCRTRLRVFGAVDDRVGDLCPGCGALLQPVADLSEIVGFRSIVRSDDATETIRSHHQALAEQVAQHVAAARPPR
jgi:hypothetical protein